MRRNLLQMSLMLVIGLAMVSCSTYKSYSYTSRSASIRQLTMSSQAPDAEVQVDFTKKVTATSQAYDSKYDAIEDALYQCITKYGVDVVVDPIYKFEFNDKYVVTVTGFAGTFKTAEDGIDVESMKSVSMDDVVKFKMLTDPSFAKYYYEAQKPVSGNVTNYYLNDASPAQPVRTKASASTAAPALAPLALPTTNETKKVSRKDAQGYEFTLKNSAIYGPTDKFICSLEFGYISKSRKIDGDKQAFLGGSKKYTPGFRFGLGINPTFKYGLGFKTGLYMDYVHYADRDDHDIAFNIPLQVSYRYEFVKNLSAFIYLGPALDFELWNDSKGGVYDTDFFDFQFGIGAGIQYKRLRFTVGGEFGMVKHDNDANCQKPIMASLSIML
ncbi:MAG: hypothetical protein KBS70_07475 [Bacteroidales bacterium]|nr:hypothetical protein [Candidatus Colicola equi]